jgi:hypothetical protein
LCSDHSSWIGQLNERIPLQQRIADTVNDFGRSAVGQVVKAGTVDGPCLIGDPVYAKVGAYVIGS